MGKVAADISVSLDGFVAGPNDGVDNGLGDGGERLHEWVVGLKSWREAHGYEGGDTGPADDAFQEATANLGATVMGRRMFDHGEGPWGEEPPFHGPVFVLTHRPRDPLVKEGGTTFTFVSDGIESALAQARDAANGKDVAVASGQAIQQFLAGGLLDEINLHLVPIFLGGGVRLFDRLGPDTGGLECVEAVPSPGVTHLKYRVAS